MLSKIEIERPERGKKLSDLILNLLMMELSLLEDLEQKLIFKGDLKQ